MENITDPVSTGELATQYMENVLDYFPENPAQDLFGRSWMKMTDSFTTFQITVWGSVILHELIYFGVSIPGFIFQFLPFMQRFKIQNNETEDAAEQWKCLKWLMMIHFAVQAPASIIFFTFVEKTGIPCDWGHMPRWYDILLRVLACLVIEDTWHYFMHRAIHHKSVYKYMHKVHHHFQAPFGMSAQFYHPGETFAFGIGFLIGLLLFTNHLIVGWAWMGARLVETVDVHSGYEFPYLNPMNLIPGYAGSRFHDFHHSNFVGNYASTFVWWDWVFGTDKQYREFIKQQKASSNGKLKAQ